MPVKPDVAGCLAMDRDDSPAAEGRRGRVLLIVERYPSDGRTGEGAELRYQGLAAGLRAWARTDVLAVAAARAAVGCGTAQCSACVAPPLRLAGATVRVPFNRGYCQRAAQAMLMLIDDGRYDAVVISHLLLHGYVAHVKERCGRPVVVDLHNAEADLCSDMAAHPDVGMVDGGYIDAERAMAVEHIEAAVVNRADHVTVPAEPDRQRLLRRHRRPTPVSVVPNTVAACEPAGPAGAGRIESAVFVGALSYFPNLLAARELCGATGAAIRAAVPGLRLTVVGRDPSPTLAAAAAAADVRLVADPESVRPFLDQAILVVPLTIGGGTRFKILEAMAAGCPVVSTAKGIEGIRALPGVHYLPAETPTAFGAAVRHTVDDPAATLRRVTAARALVRDEYSTSAATSAAGALLRAVGVPVDVA